MIIRATPQCGRDYSYGAPTWVQFFAEMSSSALAETVASPSSVKITYNEMCDAAVVVCQHRGSTAR